MKSRYSATDHVDDTGVFGRVGFVALRNSGTRVPLGLANMSPDGVNFSLLHDCPIVAWSRGLAFARRISAARMP